MLCIVMPRGIPSSWLLNSCRRISSTSGRAAKSISHFSLFPYQHLHLRNTPLFSRKENFDTTMGAILSSVAALVAPSFFESPESDSSSSSAPQTSVSPSPSPSSEYVYQRPQYLDPSNFLEGPLSENPAMCVYIRTPIKSSLTCQSLSIFDLAV